ncbi:hypothetical protein [Streptomyces sp. H39-C1]|uniref:hypothetical protein n=1 Tax=Streptomyces sp. H39-C1 TaxID=3004355 RepID=UPI0022AF259C|nr:hypothetical protein [Streptomyces sp. H39-C1]MCZ4103329.1 hypothetical protein [Streptomyces sp. H39-C1]
MLMKQLGDFLKEYVTPAVKPAGFKKMGKYYQLSTPSGDAAFLEFNPVRVDPDYIVFYAHCSIVPEPYWQWLNRHCVVTGVPSPNPSGALAGFSLIPPKTAAYTPSALGVLSTRWAFNETTRVKTGGSIDLVLRTDVIPRVQRLLIRDKLLEAIISTDKPSIRLWGALQSELVLMVDKYSLPEFEESLSRIDLNPSIKAQLVAWAEIRQGRN